jgi:hypothetical protein
MRTVIVDRTRSARHWGGADEGRWALARAIGAVTSVVVGLIVIGIALVVLEANPSNDIVAAILDAARWLVGPFQNLFTLDGDWRIVVNWGLAALVYSIAGRFLAGLAAR